MSYEADKQVITRIIESMFKSICWNKSKAPDLEAFAADVRAEATIIPSARPAVPTNIQAFLERMKGLHEGGSITSFQEGPLQTVVHVFGNLAVAIGGFELNTDGSVSRGANGFLFVRDAERWQIAGMSWDNEAPGKPLPEILVKSL